MRATGGLTVLVLVSLALACGGGDGGAEGIVEFEPSEEAGHFKVMTDEDELGETWECDKVGTIRSGARSGQAVVSCSSELPAKTALPEMSVEVYALESETSWASLRATMPVEGDSAGYLLEAAGITLTVDEQVVVPPLQRVEQPWTVEDGEISFWYHSPEPFSSDGLEVMFEHEQLGKVWSTKSYVDTPQTLGQGGAFVAEARGGTTLVYKWSPRVVHDRIAWTGGHHPPADAKFEHQDLDCAGTPIRGVNIESVDPAELVKVGRSGGADLFRALEAKHPVNGRAFVAYEAAAKAGTLAGTAGFGSPAFLKNVPYFLKKDTFGRWVRYVRSDLQPPAMCEPVVYIYDDQQRAITLQIDPAIELFKSVPKRPASGVWRVSGDADGQVRDLVTGAVHPYLFWEGQWHPADFPASGTQVAGSQLRQHLTEVSPRLGLQGREIDEFVGSWAPRLEHEACVSVAFHDRTTIDAMAPMRIEPEPSVVIRVMLDVVPCRDAPDLLPVVWAPVPQRSGFTVVEWGGLLRPSMRKPDSRSGELRLADL